MGGVLFEHDFEIENESAVSLTIENQLRKEGVRAKNVFCLDREMSSSHVMTNVSIKSMWIIMVATSQNIADDTEARLEYGNITWNPVG